MRINQSRNSILLYDGENATNQYVGEAPVNSVTTDPVWRIYRIAKSGTASFARYFADGADSYTKIWDNRASYTY